MIMTLLVLYLFSFVSLSMAGPIRQQLTYGNIASGEKEAVADEYLRFLSDSMSMSMPSPAPSTASPTASPTKCELTEGTTFTFDSFLKESDLIFDDIYVHQKFSITVKCDCNGKAVNGGTVGPTTQVDLVDDTEVDGPIVQFVNNKELQVDWEGGAVEEDAPGWSIAATGAGLCFTPAIKGGVCLLVAGLATEVFDDEVLWGYRRSASFKCVESGDSWAVEMKEMGPPLKETFKTNESEFYTDFTSSSAAAAAAGITSSSHEKLFDAGTDTASSASNASVLNMIYMVTVAGTCALVV